ncbi:MAG TPA: cytochrome-c oxidase, cbb3-type subunit III [Woeseiaceae bacterium]|nr:cytochrome-c oxidase, cbb3-type subunit III [Woeseiaceae bacterium]
MSAGWSWYVLILTLASVAACFWLIAWTNRQRASDAEIAESEAHVWDEDIRELNNPLPMWWLWLFIITLIWGLGYFIMYPSFSEDGGLLGWSQEAQYEAEVAAAEERYGPIFASFGAMPVEELVDDPKAMNIGSSLFANYCSQCHGANALGAAGFPNLTDGVWNWGGSPAQIELAISNGRTGVMPALGAVFESDEAIDEMVRYVQNMASEMDTASPAHTKYMQLCIACHGPTGQGMQPLGAPSLVDDVWLYGSSASAIRKSIVEGRNGVMPAHQNMLGPDRIRILAAYVYSLSR